MKTIGFIISDKESEKRRAILPSDLKKNVSNIDYVYIEKNYGKVLGLSDDEYRHIGCHVVSRKEVMTKDILCDPKVGDAKYLGIIKNKIVFGWIHAVQNKEISDAIVNGKNTGIAWENMFENEKHTFFRNNQLAGEAACLHAFLHHGSLPIGKKVALLGFGNVAHGAYNVLIALGAKVDIYRKNQEQEFKHNIADYDVIVNGILWDVKRTDHIIYKTDLKKLKPNCLIIDISCDRHGGIESSIPTTIENPIYVVDGVTHYVVDHTPTLVYREASASISKAITPFLDQLIEDKLGEVLKQAMIIDKGKIIDKRIIEFQVSHQKLKHSI